MSGRSETLRTFVAVELPREALEEVARRQRELASRLPGRALRWTRPEGIHLTLKFLGDTPAEAVADLESALRAGLDGQARFALSLASLGVFPNSHSPRVVWIGLAGDVDSLGAARARVEAAISPLGYPTDRRPFSPHLTLARVADFASAADRRAVGAAVEVSPRPRASGFYVAEVHLVRSELGPGGARYTPLFSVPLV